MPESWTWPPNRALTLYYWSWFDPAIGEVVAGWSLGGETDERDYIHLEAERWAEARTRQVYREGFPFVEPHTFTVMIPLPLELLEADGRPFPWIRELLGQP